MDYTVPSQLLNPPNYYLFSSKNQSQYVVIYDPLLYAGDKKLTSAWLVFDLSTLPQRSFTGGRLLTLTPFFTLFQKWRKGLRYGGS